MPKRMFTLKQINKIYDCKSFYKTLHLLEDFKKGNILYFGDMRINNNTAEIVYQTILNNWEIWRKKRGNPKNIKRYINLDQQTDWLNFAPKTDANVEEWCIEWDKKIRE